MLFAPYDAVQTVDLLVGITSGRLLLYKRCRNHCFGWFGQIGYHTLNRVIADAFDSCCTCEKREKKNRTF